MSGAAVLCGSGALRGGAGLVTVAVPEPILPIVAAGNPCYLTAPLPQDEHGKLSTLAEARILELAQVNDIAAIGPGLGQSAEIKQLLSHLIRNIKMPMVLDADGINALAGQTDSLKDHAAPIILTPHPGEFARLISCDVPTVQARRQELAAQFAQKYDVVVVLKGHATVVTDGRRIYQNPTGNPGMATGGTGDVLTGLIAALLAKAWSRSRPPSSVSIFMAWQGIWRKPSLGSVDDCFRFTDLSAPCFSAKFMTRRINRRERGETQRKQ